MLSVISISREPEKVDRLQKNLELVFGKSDPWELLVADGTEQDIFQGYNMMAAQAAGDVLAFTHDDVQFLGNRTVFDTPFELMKKPMTGFVGAAGTTVMPAEGCWWKSPQESCRGAVFHPERGTSVFGMHLNCWPWQGARFGQVVVCDGVLLMCSRRTFEQVEGFDAKTFAGFHFYDVDITLRAHLMGLVNYVAPVPLVHSSHGMTNDNWEENRLKFVEKHKKVLPAKL